MLWFDWSKVVMGLQKKIQGLIVTVHLSECMQGQILRLILAICAVACEVDGFSALKLAPVSRTPPSIPGVQRNGVGSSTRGRQAGRSATATEVRFRTQVSIYPPCLAVFFHVCKQSLPSTLEEPTPHTCTSKAGKDQGLI